MIESSTIEALMITLMITFGIIFVKILKMQEITLYHLLNS
jgi:hypothetical protein